MLQTCSWYVANPHSTSRRSDDDDDNDDILSLRCFTSSVKLPSFLEVVLVGLREYCLLMHFKLPSLYPVLDH